ncbi:plasmid related protein [Erwinia sp. V71]|uniref:plasmid related protein n=1 Tax=Erwinia sp. V71 TaxID=3369424 RepID=UPI003F60119E
MAYEALFNSVVPQPRFLTGQLVMTGGVDELVREGRLNPGPYLARHLGADWGDLDDSDWQSNDTALRTGEDRLFSSYQVEPDLKLWIITEWDRSVTTLLLPDEY